jgi:hypothetical protein
MPRFIVMAIMPNESQSGPPPKPDPEAFVVMQKYNEELVKAGVLLAAEGLAPASKGVRVKVTGEERLIIDGPFTEAKELVAGFSIFQCKTMEEAVEWVKRAPRVGDGIVEIRKLMDMDDFKEMLDGDFTPNEEVAKVKF